MAPRSVGGLYFKKMKKSSFKKSVRIVHLWLGMASGIVVFIMAITGCLYAFQMEIQDLTQEYRHVEAQNTEFLPPSILEKIARAEVPNKILHAIQYSEPDKAAEAIFYSYEPEYYYISYINPYTGAVQATVDQHSGFFPFILDGHFNLWLPHEIGRPIIASATLIFIFMLISGLILWYPKNKKAAKQRFWFRWKDSTKWKRKNYDFHNITGFYIMMIAMIFALTGLVWGFDWFASGYYSAMGGEKSLVYEDPVSEKKTDLALATNPLDKAWLMMREQYPNAKSIEVHPPETAQSSIAANANPEDGTYWKIDYRYFDQYTLEEKTVEHVWGRFPDATLSDKVMRMNYDIHTGAILGLPGKIFAFLISLLIATLPITGFMVWLGRKNKRKKATLQLIAE